MSIIEELYRGSIFPAEQIRPDGEAYRNARKRSLELALELNNQLGASQKELWGRYITALTDETDLCYLETFRQGMLIGARLAIELLPFRNTVVLFHPIGVTGSIDNVRLHRM